MTLIATLKITAAVAGALVAGTFLLPRNVHVERTAVVLTPSDTVVALAASNSGYQAFNPYKSTDPNLRIELYGPENGVGAAFRFEGKDGKGTQTVASVSDSQVTYAIDLGPMGKPSQAIVAEPVEEGTKVTWTMDADMGFNPIARVMGLFMDGMVGPSFEKGLENLANVNA